VNDIFNFYTTNWKYSSFNLHVSCAFQRSLKICLSKNISNILLDIQTSKEGTTMFEKRKGNKSRKPHFSYLMKRRDR
jgi:hypothetical protein